MADTAAPAASAAAAGGAGAGAGAAAAAPAAAPAAPKCTSLVLSLVFCFVLFVLILLAKMGANALMHTARFCNSNRISHGELIVPLRCPLLLLLLLLRLLHAQCLQTSARSEKSSRRSDGSQSRRAPCRITCSRWCAIIFKWLRIVAWLRCVQRDGTWVSPALQLRRRARSHSNIEGKRFLRTRRRVRHLGCSVSATDARWGGRVVDYSPHCM